MRDPKFVWAKDMMTGSSSPIPRTVAEAHPDRYITDEAHPVRDSLGVLLDAKHATSKLARTRVARTSVENLATPENKPEEA